jgi:hypothetical protein
MNFYIIIYAIIVVVAIFVLYYYQVQREQMSSDFAPIEVPVIPKYQNITPTQLYGLFNDDLDKMTQAMIASKIPIVALKSPSYYPKIASILAKNKLI